MYYMKRKFEVEIERLNESFSDERREIYRSNLENLQKETAAIKDELSRVFEKKSAELISAHEEELRELKSELDAQASSTTIELEDTVTKLKLEKERSRAKDALILELKESQSQSTKEIVELKRALREIASELQRVKQQQTPAPSGGDKAPPRVAGSTTTTTMKAKKTTATSPQSSSGARKAAGSSKGITPKKK
jgi:chromosome segregation ATPase